MKAPDLKGRNILGNILTRIKPTVAYFNPQFYFDEQEECWVKIPSDAFPKMGSLVVRLQGGFTFDDVVSKYCPNGSTVVEARFKRCDEDESPDSNNIYSTRYTPLFEGDFTFNDFAPKGLIQILKLNISYTDLYKNRKYRFESTQHILSEKVLVQCNDSRYYGPFQIIDDVFEIKFKPASDSHFIKMIESDSIENSVISIRDTDSSEYIFFHDLSEILSNINTEIDIDWLEDEEIINYLNISLKKNTTSGIFSYSRNQLQEIRESFLSVVDDTYALSTKSRICRANRIIEETSLNETLFEKTINTLLNKEPERIAAIFEKDEYFAHIQNLIPELNVCKAKIQQLKNQIDDLSHTKETLEFSCEPESELYEKVKNERDALLHANRILQEKHDKLFNEHNQMKDDEKTLVMLKESITEHKFKLKNALQDERDAEHAFQEVINKYTSKIQGLAEGINLKLINKIYKNLDEHTTCLPIENEKSTNQLFAEYNDANELVDAIQNYLSDANYIVTDDDIFNYLICITQSFITTFAGEPGTGKTSLCNLLSESLGLIDNSKDCNPNFCEISVERGWTSHKDYIAYHNPLSNRLEITNNAVYKTLSNANYQYKENEEVSPYWILLDEANLSPIEHYWASFLKMCDTEANRERVLNLGAHEKISIPPFLRFLGTVNFDHTTESLSPRFLDRSWIIVLEPKHIEYGESENFDISDNITNTPILPVKATDLDRFFLPKEGQHKINPLIKDKYESIARCFKEASMPLSIRNQFKIQRYISVAQDYIGIRATKNPFMPLDYAIAQKALPLINGCGDNYDKLLANLKDICASKMPTCTKHIERMIELSLENNGYYQFFARR